MLSSILRVTISLTVPANSLPCQQLRTDKQRTMYTQSLYVKECAYWEACFATNMGNQVH